MIKVENLSKQYPVGNQSRIVLDKLNFSIVKGQKVGILGRNGAGKSTLIRLLSGIEEPTSGRIIRDMTLSWPIAFSGAFQGSLTGMDNLRFICRIYDVDQDYVKDFVVNFTELGRYLYEPVKRYSSGMKARLAFALSLAVEFDCYMVDEILAVGDSRFTEKCNYELFEKRKDRAMILVSHNAKTIRKYCDTAMVLENGNLKEFNNIDDAYKEYTSIT